jgi:hypothetical protein
MVVEGADADAETEDEDQDAEGEQEEDEEEDDSDSENFARNPPSRSRSPPPPNPPPPGPDNGPDMDDEHDADADAEGEMDFEDSDQPPSSSMTSFLGQAAQVLCRFTVLNSSTHFHPLPWAPSHIIGTDIDERNTIFTQTHPPARPRSTRNSMRNRTPFLPQRILSDEIDPHDFIRPDSVLSITCAYEKGVSGSKLRGSSQIAVTLTQGWPRNHGLKWRNDVGSFRTLIHTLHDYSSSSPQVLPNIGARK